MTTTAVHEADIRTGAGSDTGWGLASDTGTDTETGTRAATPTGTERPVPRWAEHVAHAIPLVLLAQCVWRLPFAFGFDMGTGTGSIGSLWISVPYIFTLSLLTEALALLSFGLVRGWGEVVPAWVPRLGGRRLNRWVAVVPATLGGLGATALFGPFTLGALGLGVSFEEFDSGFWEFLFRACVLPVGLWGPLVLALTVHYFVRRGPSAARAAIPAVNTSTENPNRVSASS
ncbi:hypothetical protein [Streptomyces alboflavus]|mgnify:CR=1 FL=1|uniref:hypothetical protein n=1 Tax=Streptomyces alboflavus TaxID=67267 RepID=UPI001F026964|nr:hypothetical protein [Streptomyces alboflavus]